MTIELTAIPILTWIGLITTITFLIGLIDFIAPLLRPSQINRFLHAAQPSPNTSSPPLHPWALITGTTSGIGLALAHELASLGFNIVLHGRNPSKLATVQHSLQTTFPARQFRTLPVDASTCTQSPDIFKDIIARLSDIHLTVLINNAGGGTTAPTAPSTLHTTSTRSPQSDPYTPLPSHTHASITSLIALNLTFPLLLTSSLLPHLSHRNNGPSLIITIGSLADTGFPLISIYSGAKAALRFAIEGLAREINFPPYHSPIAGVSSATSTALRDNLTIHHMRLASVTNTSVNQGKPSLFEIDAATCARGIIARVGCGRTVIEPHWTVRLQAVAGDWFPWWLKDRVFVRAIVEKRDEYERDMEGEVRRG